MFKKNPRKEPSENRRAMFEDALIQINQTSSSAHNLQYISFKVILLKSLFLSVNTK